MKRIILVDGMHVSYRMFHVHEHLATSEGRPSGIVFGVLSNILNLHKIYPDASIVFCWDKGTTWRKQLDPTTYKRMRGEERKRPNEVTTQINSLQNEFLSVLGIKQVAVDSIEADDLIGILSQGFEDKKEPHEVLIYSGDRDMYQLVSMKTKVVSIQGIKVKEVIDRHTVYRNFNILPNQWCSMRSVSGDKSDGIIGIDGIGPKKAAMMIAQGFNPTHEKPKLEACGKFADEIEANWAKIQMNYKLSLIPRYIADLPLKLKCLPELEKQIESVIREPYRVPQHGAGEKIQESMLDYELVSLLPRRREFWTIS